MGYSAAAVIDYVVTSFAAEGATAAASTAAGASTAAEAGTAAAAVSGTGLSATGTGLGLSTGATTATLGGSGVAGGAATGTGITLGNAAAAASLASTAYALTKGVPKVPTPGQITPADNGAAISQAADVEARDRERALAGGASSTMLTGGRGSGLGATTSSALLGS